MVILSIGKEENRKFFIMSFLNRVSDSNVNINCINFINFMGNVSKYKFVFLWICNVFFFD